MKKRPLDFLARITARGRRGVGIDDWRRAYILAELLAPPLARRQSPPRQKIVGAEDPYLGD